MAAAQTEEKEIIAGTVVNVVYTNHDNGYTVLSLDSEEYGRITLVGQVPECAPGEMLQAEGSWKMHPRHGRQFQADTIEREMPATAQAVLQYLSAGTVKGIGPVTAERIVQRFGDAALDVIELDPQRLTEIRGITAEKARQIGADFLRKAGVRRLMDFLTEYQLPPYLAIRLMRICGDEALVMLQNDPYLLTREEIGVEFSRADALALALGIDGQSMERVTAGVSFELRHNLGNGHCFIPRGKLASATAALLAIPEEVCLQAIEQLEQTGQIITEQVAGLDACYLYEYYEAEVFVAGRFREMAAARCPFSGNVDHLVDITQSEQGIVYAKSQRDMVRLASVRQLVLLTGGPGTGKTTSVRGILSLFERMGLETVLAAPTGRAAKRLSELTGTKATTIHRLLEAGYDRETGEMCFAKNHSDPLKADAVVVDECSMVDLMLMRSLLDALKPGCRLVLVGDADQLPSVGAGKVFADLISSGVAETVRLTEIFRQARESDIVVNAHRIQQGVLPELGKNDRDLFFLRRRSPQKALETITELCAVRLPERMGIAPSEIQVLTPMRKGMLGTINLNFALQEVLNPPSDTKKEKRFRDFVFREGDRVMQIKNNYDTIWKNISTGEEGAGIYNGDVGVITSIDEGETVTVRFDDRLVCYSAEQLEELELAFAMTVHKAQGSEYRAVILATLEVPGMLRSRGVLYTAVTRARELLIIVGDDEIISQMTANYRLQRRYSGLRTRLMHG